MRTLAEFLGLARAAGTLWWRRLARMTFWFTAGFVVQRLCLYVSVLLGSAHGVLATVVFVVGVVAVVAAMILTIEACGSGHDESGRTRLDVLALTIGPFLTAYALWGLVDDQVGELFLSNVVLTGLGGVDQWSVDLRRVGLYVALAAVAWVSRLALGAVNRRFDGRLVAVAVLAEGLWTVAWLLAAIGLASRAMGWLRSRAVWQGGVQLWYDLLGRLPELRLPFDLTLPQALIGIVNWLTTVLLPAIGHGVLLPLAWLALTATVLGWQSGTARDLVATSRWRDRTAAVEQRLAGRPVGPVTRLALVAGDLLTGDLRAKFLPVAHALRLVLRAGPRFVGTYLVLATLAAVLPTYAFVGLDALLGPAAQADYLARLGFVDLAADWSGTTVAVAVYVAAFRHAASGPGSLSDGPPAVVPASPARSTD